MSGFTLITALYLLAYPIFKNSSSYCIESIGGRKCWRVKPLYAFVFIIPLIIFAFQRDSFFGDTPAYITMYNHLPESLTGLIQELTLNPKDPGFTVLCWIFSVAGVPDRIFLLILAFFQIGSVALIFRKYSSNYYFSILLFLLSSDYYLWVHNSIRQFLAVTIIFLATPWILENKSFKSILVILFASLFHQSALLIIPVIFIVQGKALNRRLLIVSCLFFLSIVFLSEFTSILDGFLKSTQYENVVTDYTVGSFNDDNGTSPLRALIYSLPFLIAIAGYKVVEKKQNSIINLSVNMSFITALVYVLSIFTSGIFIGRIPIYFSLYNYILLPWELNHMFKKTQVLPLTLLTIAFYVLFSYYQLHISWGL